jgi:hypothetical protein
MALEHSHMAQGVATAVHTEENILVAIPVHWLSSAKFGLSIWLSDLPSVCTGGSHNLKICRLRGSRVQ